MPNQQPNILIIQADQLAAQALPSYGHPLVQDIDSDFRPGMPEVRIRPDRQKMALVNMPVGTSMTMEFTLKPDTASGAKFFVSSASMVFISAFCFRHVSFCRR